MELANYFEMAAGHKSAQNLQALDVYFVEIMLYIDFWSIYIINEKLFFHNLGSNVNYFNSCQQKDNLLKYMEIANWLSLYIEENYVM